MIRSLLFKRSLVLLLVLTLFSGGAAFAEQGGDQSLKVNFSDVPNGNWAQKHVSKLALLGVTEGYEDGTFRPANSVSQEEVIIMALRLMGYSEADANIEATQPNHIINFLNEHVASWAQKYVSLAFSHGVLDYNFEISNVGNGKWGEKKATREWVAKLVIQSIGEEKLADDLRNTNTKFTDNGTISGWALGYVNVAAERGIVTGSTDGKFNPQDLVTRAELAAFLSRGENHMSERSERVKVGTLTELSPSRINILNKSGQNESFALHHEQKFYSYKAPNDAISISQVKLHTKVAVIAHNSTAYYVEVIDDALQLLSLEGKLAHTVQNNDDMIYLEVNGQNRPYMLDPYVAVLNMNGSGSNLRDLVTSSLLSVKFDTMIGDTINSNSRIVEIKVISEPVNKKATGYVEQIDIAKEQIQLRASGSNAIETYEVSDTLDITYGSRSIKLSDLNVGDEVDYSVDNSVLTSVNVTQSINPYEETVQGVINNTNLARNTLTIELSPNEFKTNVFARNVTVLLEGHNSPTINELENDDMVKISINAMNEITKVEVMNRKINRLNQVEIATYDTITSGLAVRIDGKLRSYEITNDTTIKIDEAEYNKTNFNFATHFVEGKKVDMTFTNDKLMEVKLSSYYEGIVKQVFPTTRSFTLETDDGVQSFTLTNFNSFVHRYNSSSTSVNDLRAGDAVRVVLNDNQTQVNYVHVRETVLYHTISTSLPTRMVKVRDRSGEEKNLAIFANVPIKHYAKSSPTFTDINADDLLIVTYLGVTIEAVEVSEVSFGTIKEINTMSRKLAVSRYDNQSREWSWQHDPQVYDGATNKIKLLSSLRSGDRVQVVVDNNGRLFITTLQPVDKNFWKYDKTESKVFARNEQLGYTLAQDAYVSHNGKKILVTDLVGQGFPQVKFYMLNGVVYEIERQ